jgi:F-type H+-transporting ATPase subunit gamma
MRLDELRVRIRTASELDAIVNTMRVLSQTRLLQAERTFGHLRRFSRETEHALERGLALVLGGPGALGPGKSGATALLVLGSEHGFVGALDEKIVEAARAEASKDPATTVFLAGSELARTARDRGLASEGQRKLPSSATSFEPMARAFTEAVAERLARGEFWRGVILGPRRRGRADWEIAVEQIFPVTVPASRAPAPFHFLPPQHLVVKLIEEFVFSKVAAAIAEAFLTEQLARVHSMEATRKSLEDKLEELRRAERVVRQEVITSELLEVVAGAAALESER